MRIRVVARENIINYQNGRTYDDEGLEALGSIKYGPLKEVPIFNLSALTQEEKNLLIDEFCELNPEFCAQEYDFEVVDD